jgi:hypothetical protein
MRSFVSLVSCILLAYHEMFTARRKNHIWPQDRKFLLYDDVLLIIEGVCKEKAEGRNMTHEKNKGLS